MAAWRSKRENEKVEIHVYTIEAARVKKKYSSNKVLWNKI